MTLPRFWRLGLLPLLALSISIGAKQAATPPTPVHAQDSGTAACETLVQQAIREIGSTCRELGRNEACYGNTRIEAELSDEGLSFAANGDIVGVEALTRLVTQPADPDTGEWGIAVLDLQADLPESAEGNVRLLLFGGVDVQPVVADIDPEQPTCAIRNDGQRGVNFRVGPGPTYEIVDSLRPGDETSGYGVSADGEWFRTPRGWIAGDFTRNDCDTVNLLSIAAAAEAYFAPMQNFTLSLTSTGSCDSAPDGLLIQAPTDEVANIMINNVELRVGSTAFLTFDRTTDEMYIGNMDGDVTVTTNGIGRRLRPGQETIIDMGLDVAERTPLLPRPFGAKMDAMRDDMLAALPDPIERPGLFVPSDATLADAIEGSGDGIAGPGRWLPCGSCNTCGYPQAECVTSPDGQCLWDPASCRREVGSFVSGPASLNCASPTDIKYYFINYNNPGGQTIVTASALSVFGADVVEINPTNLKVKAHCPTSGTDTVSVKFEDTDGVSYGFSTTISYP